MFDDWFKKWNNYPKFFPDKDQKRQQQYDDFRSDLTLKFPNWIVNNLIKVDAPLVDHWVGKLIQEDPNRPQTLATWYTDTSKTDATAKLAKNVKPLLDSVLRRVPPNQGVPIALFNTERIPFHITMDAPEKFAKEYDQFFGTQVCMAAAKPENRDFMRVEMYKLWIKQLKREKRSSKTRV